MAGPNQIPAVQQIPPIIVCRGMTPDQLQVDLLAALAAGYLPEPGLMCSRNNEVWVICYYKPEAFDDDAHHQPEPEPEPEPPPPSVNPQIPQARQQQPGGNANETFIRGRG